MKKVITVLHEIEYEGKYCLLDCKQMNLVADCELFPGYQGRPMVNGKVETLRCDACLLATGDGPKEDKQKVKI